MLDRAMALTRDYVLVREQFGQPLASFQGVQFQLTDAEVERAGVEELAKYALWSVADRPGRRAGRRAGPPAGDLEAADIVFRIAHQLHGAIGFCDETTLSWLSRYSQPLRRLPLGLSATLVSPHSAAGPPGPHRVVQRSAVTMNYDLPDELSVEADGAVRTVIINRPRAAQRGQHNLHRALAKVWRQISADPGARAVILTGAGRTFCAGGDFDWISSFADDPVARHDSLREGAEIIEEMLRFPLPVIAAVNGAAVGLGCSIALLCDIVLVSATAHFADPHVSRGPGRGRRRGRVLAAADAHPADRASTSHRRPHPGGRGRRARAGHPRSTPAELLPEAHRLAVRLAGQPAEALRGTKQVLNMHLARALSGSGAGWIRGRGSQHAKRRASAADSGAARPAGVTQQYG